MGEKDNNTLNDEELLTKWIEQADKDDLCGYCNINDECPHGMCCYGGEPIEPPCASTDNIEKLIDTESVLEDIRGGNLYVEE